MKRALTKADRDAIRAVIAATPDIDHYNVRLSLLASGAVKVWTGTCAGPECGSGNILLVERRDGEWRVVKESITCWIA